MQLNDAASEYDWAVAIFKFRLPNKKDEDFENILLFLKSNKLNRAQSRVQNPAQSQGYTYSFLLAYSTLFVQF